jgi:hypothetical protein
MVCCRVMKLVPITPQPVEKIACVLVSEKLAHGRFRMSRTGAKAVIPADVLG